MNLRLSKYLKHRFPLTFWGRSDYWAFECGDGWYKILKDAATQLEPLIQDFKIREPKLWDMGYCRATQVKEKFGTLRFYFSGETDEMAAILKKAENTSATTCEHCGKPGKLRGRAWLYTACAKHTRKADK